MIRELGNCGHRDKIVRIIKAFALAKENECTVHIVMDPLVYGEWSYKISYKEIQNVHCAYDNNTLIISRDNEIIQKLIWWDIDRVVVVW